MYAAYKGDGINRVDLPKSADVNGTERKDVAYIGSMVIVLTKQRTAMMPISYRHHEATSDVIDVETGQ